MKDKMQKELELRMEMLEEARILGHYSRAAYLEITIGRIQEYLSK